MKKIAKFFVRIYNSYVLEEEYQRALERLESRIRYLENMIAYDEGNTKEKYDFIMLRDVLRKEKICKKEMHENFLKEWKAKNWKSDQR